MSTYLILAASTFISAIIQATMGFGSALILLNVLPFFFPLNKAIALMQVSMLFLNLVFSIIYWRKIRWDVLYPALIPAAVCGLVFTLGMFFGVRILKKIGIRFLRKLIYAFIGVNGVYIIVRQFL